MMDPRNIAELFQTNNVYITVTPDTASGHSVGSNRWQCYIMEQSPFGLLVQVYKPLQKKGIFLAWGAILSIEIIPPNE